MSVDQFMYDSIVSTTHILSNYTQPVNNNFSNNNSNNTLILQPKEISQFLTVLNKIVVPIVFGLITCVGLTGNGLVIYVIMTKERMRTVINLLLLNLAVADFSFVLVIPPSTAYQFADERWHFGSVACKLMHFLVNVTAYVTVYTLVLIAVVRYLTVVHNTKSSKFRTKPVIIGLIFTIWFVVGSVNSIILFIYDVNLNVAGEQTCDLSDNQNGKPLFASFFALGYLFPLVVIAFLSMRIARRVARNRPANSAVFRKVRSARRNKQIGKLLVIVVVLFAALWLPVHVHLLVAFFGDIPTSETYETLTVIWYCSAYSNSCVNPIIYHCASKEFRQAFREVVGCQQPTNGSAPAQTASGVTGGFGGTGTGGFGIAATVKKIKPLIEGSALNETSRIVRIPSLGHDEQIRNIEDFKSKHENQLDEVILRENVSNKLPNNGGQICCQVQIASRNSETRLTEAAPTANATDLVATGNIKAEILDSHLLKIID